MHDHQFAAEVDSWNAPATVLPFKSILLDRFDAFDCTLAFQLVGIQKFIDDLIDGGSFFVLIFKTFAMQLSPSFCRLRGSRERLDERFQSVGRSFERMQDHRGQSGSPNNRL